MRYLAALILACQITATFSPTPVIRWDYDWALIDTHAVDGFRVYADGQEVADIPCLSRLVDWCSPIDPDVCQSVELYECAGVLVQVPLQRYIERPAATEVEVRVTAYGLGGESPQSAPLTVCWPQTVHFDTSGETGRNW